MGETWWTAGLAGPGWHRRVDHGTRRMGRITGPQNIKVCFYTTDFAVPGTRPVVHSAVRPVVQPMVQPQCLPYVLTHRYSPSHPCNLAMISRSCTGGPCNHTFIHMLPLATKPLNMFLFRALGSHAYSAGTPTVIYIYIYIYIYYIYIYMLHMCV